MNVLYVTKYYYPKVGGIERNVRTLAEAVNGPEYRTRVLAAARTGLGSTETINGVPIRKTANLGERLSVPIAPLFPLELAAAARRADVLHFHLPNPLAVVSQLALGPDSPRIVVTYHSDIVKQTTALNLYRPLLRRFLQRADRIIATSPRLLRKSDLLAAHADKCTVIPLSIDAAAFGRYSGPDYDLSVDASRPVVLFVGRLVYYKGVAYLIEAMKDVDATLLIAGDGYRRAALERQVREHGLTDKVTFVGEVSRSVLGYCYDLADLFVLPSTEPSEAFGIVQLEAMAHGTPVVNTALPTGVPWVSKDGETGLTVPPGDAVALASAITRLLDDPALRRRYGENARERVERCFDQADSIRRITAVYDDLADR